MKLNKLFLMAGIAMTMFMTASCGDDDDWTPGTTTNVDSLNVYIASDNTIALPVDGNTFDVVYARNNTKGELTVPVVFTTVTPQIFTEVPSSVKFADGENQAKITISCSPDMEMFKNYKATITIPEKYTTQYAAIATNMPRAELTVVKEDFKTINKGTYYSQFNETEDSGINLQKSDVKNSYRISVSNSEFEHTFTFKVADDGTISFNEPQIYQGWAYPGYGDVYAVAASDKPSFYDSEKKTYYFGFKYGMPKVDVWFSTTAYDYFVVTEYGEAR